MITHTKRLIGASAAIALACAASLYGQEQDGVQELEAFIAEQTANEPVDSLLPTDQVVSGAFMEGMSLFETPRSVSVLSPELLEHFNISDFQDLTKFGASTERVNFYGIAGAPVLRGWQGGIYYNGMLRAFQRNEMPTSFGALDAMEIVRGAAPAQLIPSHIGGYVNMVPKAPYFDEFRGSVELELGTNDQIKGQIDAGGPILIADTIPAAYRVSVTAQEADSYFDNVSNDFISVYASAKMKLTDSTMLTFGGEFFEFKSNENAGWNRPTQNLIDNGEYVIGEPLSIVRSDTGVADRNLVNGTAYGFLFNDAEQRQWFRSLVVPEADINAALAAGTITSAQVANMLDMSDAATRSMVYDGVSNIYSRTTSGYLYTADYFAAGGEALTTSIDGSEVLADPTDFADSQDIILFSKLEQEITPDASLDIDFLYEKIETDKFTSYQYAIQTEQEVADIRATMNQSFVGDMLSLDLSYGGQLRFTEAMQLQDFWTEPMARRDISVAGVSANSSFLSGDDLNPENDIPYWLGGGRLGSSASSSAVESELSQFGVFALASVDIGEKVNVIGSVRYDGYEIETGVPSVVRAAGATRGEFDDDGLSWSINPSVAFTENLSVYGVAQEAMTYAPTQGGAVLGELNFGKGSLDELGLKVQALEGRLFTTLALFQWDQTSFNDITGFADTYESKGVEFEVTYQATDKLTLIGAITSRETFRTSPLGFRTMPFGLSDPTGASNDEIGVALNGGAMVNQFTEAVGGFSPEGSSPSANPELRLPGSPETTIKLFAVYEDLIWDGFGISGGFVYSDSYFHNYDQTLTIPSSVVVSANIFYKQESYEILLGVENLTDEDYFIGAAPTFAANNLITKAPGVEGRLSFKYKF